MVPRALKTMAPFLSGRFVGWLERHRPTELEQLETACKKAMEIANATEDIIRLEEIADKAKMNVPSSLEQLLHYKAELRPSCDPVHEELRLLRETLRNGESLVLDKLNRCKTRTLVLRRKGKVVLVKK